MKKTLMVIVALFTLALFCAPVFAQEAPKADSEFFPDLQADADMKTEETGKKPFTPSWGGWITPIFIDEIYNDTENATSLTTLKLWFNLTLWKDANLYVRGKDVFMAVLEGDTDFSSTDSIPEFDSRKYSNILDLDVGFISAKLLDKSLQVSLGRKFYIIGTGLVFNGRGDGLELNYYSKWVDVKAFGLYTGLLAKDNNPYGISSKDISDGAERIFAGGTIEKSFLNQTAYFIALGQIDTGNSESESYDSQYYGAGLRGVLPVDGLDYYGEFIYETGKIGGSDGQDISAFGGMLGVNYYADLPLNPGILFQYAYGSGEKEDKAGLKTFGTYVGGFALRPDLYNIHIVRLGLACAPLSFMSAEYLKRMNIIARYSYYRFDQSDNYEIGNALDLSLRWQVFYDLSLFLNYGIFIPDKEYDPSEENTHFVMGGATLVF